MTRPFCVYCHHQSESAATHRARCASLHTDRSLNTTDGRPHIYVPCKWSSLLWAKLHPILELPRGVHLFSSPGDHLVTTPLYSNSDKSHFNRDFIHTKGSAGKLPDLSVKRAVHTPDPLAFYLRAKLHAPHPNQIEPALTTAYRLLCNAFWLSSDPRCPVSYLLVTSRF